MKQLKWLLLFLLAFATATVSASKIKRHTFAISNGTFLYDGKPINIHSGEMHYSRVPAPYWRHRIRMMKAMGLNTVATYVFWNYHETAPGKWDWKSENRNIREFLKICQQEGMMVILRPGPYSCGEWEFGGYPWWLQREKALEVRTYNRAFLDSCRAYIGELANQTRDMQITHGGPIVMVQVENEFGAYVSQRKDIPLETHKKYELAIKQMLLDAGYDVNLFTSDGSWLFKGGALEGVLPAANGEDNVDKLKKVVNEYHGGVGPYMVAEFYPGWLEHWNEPFPRVSTENVVKNIRNYLDNDVSFNFYMIHGGTNFGFWPGANYSNDKNIQPDLTSYDYDAPISEAGWNTPKYDALRALMQQYLKHPLPAVPARIPVISMPHVKLDKTVDVLSVLEQQPGVENDMPLTFEQLGQGYGYVLYSRHFNQPISGMMRVPGIADFGVVYVNGQKVGELNRVTGCDSMQVDVPFNSTLQILVENFGRINYGARITQNNKGIIAPITIDGGEITGQWNMRGLPLSEMPDLCKLQTGYQPGRAVLYGATFSLDKVGDTFLDMSGWGKGIVFVNGFNLGRYWKVGPQQTLYLPGCYLKKGENRIVVFEQLNDTKQTELNGVTEPVLDRLVKQK